MQITFKILVVILLLLSCKNHKSPTQKGTGNYSEKEQMARASEEFHRFDSLMLTLYIDAEKNHQNIIHKTDSLIQALKRNEDPNNVRGHKFQKLHELRAEVFYKNGEYQKSIDEIFLGKETRKATYGQGFYDSENLALACDFVKLGDFKEAKRYIDSTVPGYYMYDYILGNYFEVTGNKEKALQVYRQIENDKSNRTSLHYKWALARLVELQKSQPVFLKELYYPTERPDVNIAHNSDGNKRTKLIHMFSGLPAVKNGMHILIYQDPEETQSNDFWVKIGKTQDSIFTTEFDYHVDTLAYKIRLLNTDKDKIFNLNEWMRRQ